MGEYTLDNNIKKVVLDSSAIINYAKKLEEMRELYKFIVPTTVVDELDNMKESDSPRRKFMGRTGLRFLENNENYIEYIVTDKVKEKTLPEDFDKGLNDNKIISCAVDINALLATQDRGMKIKANSLNIEILELENDKNVNYDGYKVFTWDCQDKKIAIELEKMANDDTINIFELEPNQFAVLKDTNQPLFDEDGIKDEYKVIAITQWTGEKNIPMKVSDINCSFLGKVKPRNLEQKMLLSILQNKNINIVLTSGTYGTGKDYLMLSQAVNMVQKGDVDKIVWFRNPVQVKGVQELGFLKGSLYDKLEPYSAVLDDILGAQFGTDIFLSNGTLEIGFLGAVRGRTFTKTLVILTEAQNCSKEIIQLLISRLGEGSRIFINGDYNQIDDVYDNGSSIAQTIEVLTGVQEFGHIKLKKVERSKVADLARLFDEN